ncbi:MAG: hypothetical protein JSV10_08710 [Candidatus Zixiibacteriota bacterium]|nr:MAG: hypothetical protein JSV10_08710 [candidate division Zixibacteria bacterium]
MRNRVFLTATMGLFGLALFGSIVSAQEEGEIYVIDILHDGQGWHIEPCPMPGTDGDTWRIRNLSSDTVCVWVVVMVGDKNPFQYVLAPMDSVDQPVSIWLCGLEVFLGVCFGGPFLTECKRPCGPVLTQWGSFALVAMMTSITVWVFLRRKTRYVTSV